MWRMEAEYGGWGVGPAVAMLCVVMLLIFLPLGMGQEPIQPPPFSVLLVFPVLVLVILIFLSYASK